MKSSSLPQALLNIIKNKGTEPPFSGVLNEEEYPGTYLCRQCGLALFRSHHKFHSGCGWPSFDEEIPATIKRQRDADGSRTEIVCARCDAHLGHVFQGEQLTAKNTRHCVNSLSLEFVEDTQVTETEEAIFAAGCFWGVEALFKKLKGVLKTEVGYTGGHLQNPTYRQVCEGQSGHVEAIRVLYDKEKLSYDDLVKYFFEIHDPTQFSGQGPDLGDQYHSVIFYYDEKQKETAEKYRQQLESKGSNISTRIVPVKTFWPAEDYHQDYYTKSGKQPYCHRYTKRF